MLWFCACCRHAATACYGSFMPALTSAVMSSCLVHCVAAWRPWFWLSAGYWLLGACWFVVAWCMLSNCSVMHGGCCLVHVGFCFVHTGGCFVHAGGAWQPCRLTAAWLMVSAACACWLLLLGAQSRVAAWCMLRAVQCIDACW